LKSEVDGIPAVKGFPKSPLPSFRYTHPDAISSGDRNVRFAVLIAVTDSDRPAKAQRRMNDRVKSAVGVAAMDAGKWRTISSRTGGQTASLLFLTKKRVEIGSKE
jgi:hypothetical protein